MTNNKSTYLQVAGDYSRGQEGILYIYRDMLIGIFILYGIVCIIIDLIWHKKFAGLLPTVIGLLLAIYGAAVDIIHIYTRIHFDFFKDFVKDKLKRLKKDKKRIKLKARLKTFFSTEPKTYDLSFEYLELEDSYELIGKAVSIHEDIILKYIQAESGKYVIDNYLLTIEEISNRLVNYLPKFLNDDSISQIRIGLREILINAVEHGNLNISYEEKSEAIRENNYFIFIRNRQKDPQFMDKKIIIEYSLSPGKVVYRITDQGKGCDVKEFNKLKDDSENFSEHGRGILMATNVFDKVAYNNEGNRVTLVKEFNKG